MLDQVAGEYRLNITESGIRVECTDTANVMAIFTEIDADAFETYEVDETTLGIGGKYLGQALQHARYAKNTDDKVILTADAKYLETTVNRTFGDTDTTLTERTGLTDPGSIRSPPDLPDVELTASATIEPSAFTEISGILDDDTKTDIRGRDGRVQIRQSKDEEGRQIHLTAEGCVETEWSYYSTSYLQDIAAALNNGYVDTVTLRFEGEMPLMVDFEREGYYSGSLMVAPRRKA